MIDKVRVILFKIKLMKKSNKITKKIIKITLINNKNNFPIQKMA